MLKTKSTYFVLIIATIALGLLSRHVNGIPLFIGDILWGLMVYFIVRFLLIGKKIKWAVAVSLIFSYSIEASQLYQAHWINNIRHTIIGGLILGYSFLWSDMLCYTAGIGVGALIDIKLVANQNNISR
ncbi:DUF2809 domain-containing protein [Mucilaginibacter sp. L3T2-6]|uniref:ribosomal maturation YjgA family protein n=1 Tax=Mucilaginibacter sp. L3T2-6 TaxID=3062491 RepID=UPI0026756606|nr:DUF2809 domain-containing protein [Mucilaginibacter sp. L3T2-6]MDO3643757.1 DUF2809 domain-containing protein [Mucilaginibacter sp. L3T2-6]MDV6216208.1 DUF2809 domain-containing protein [Mucilaginibacter sp. L3T2-6]